MEQVPTTEADALRTRSGAFVALAVRWYDDRGRRPTWMGETRAADGRIVGECDHLHRSTRTALACAMECAQAWERAVVERRRAAELAYRAVRRDLSRAK